MGTAMNRTTKILYFAWVRERIGSGEEDVALPDGIGDVASLVAWLRTRGPGFEAAFAQPGQVRAAVNQVFARPETQVAPGDEVAFFPPVTGG
jgi:molybdopterin synthase sulfur carrier subunit